MNIAVLLISHDRITDVKIGMELIKKLWQKEDILKKVDIFHAYNGPKQLYPKPYLETKLIRRKNINHYDGAADLIDTGMAEIFATKKNYDFILVMSGDVWLINPEFIASTLKLMKSKKIFLSTTLWPNTFLIPNIFATEFFIISEDFAKKIFPLNLVEFFKNKIITNFFYQLFQPLPVIAVPKVELCFTSKVLKELKTSFWNFNWKKFIYLFPQRKVMFAYNRFYSPKMGYLSHHNLKRKILLLNKEKKLRNIFLLTPNLLSQLELISK